MTVSRWKVMAGMLGISLGGLAAIAGQTPKPGENRADLPTAADTPMPMTPKSATPTLDIPAPGTLPALPVLPSTTTKQPAPLPVLPILSEPPVADAKKATPTPTPAKPEIVPVSGITIPTPTPTPATQPPIEPPAYAPPIVTTTQAPTVPSAPPVGIDPIPVKPAPSSAAPAPLVMPQDSPKPATTNIELPAGFTPPATATAPAMEKPVAAAAVAAVASKYRILLRVGEGEPSFEVRSGDDMVLKVVSEKVDITSPNNKGQTTSQVKASGKVRFVGFGSEGTCDELSFAAGTGALQLSGNVTIQVKDKLGRVDSELKSDKVQYKLDAATIPGVMKP